MAKKRVQDPDPQASEQDVDPLPFTQDPEPFPDGVVDPPRNPTGELFTVSSTAPSPPLVDLVAIAPGHWINPRQVARAQSCGAHLRVWLADGRELLVNAGLDIPLRTALGIR
jgi:hypothetical protein